MNNNIIGFDSQRFMGYLSRNFSSIDNNYYLRSLVENILESSANYISDTAELIKYFQAIFPEIEFGELAIFVDDDYLTDEGKKEKRLYKSVDEIGELWERQRDIENGRDVEYKNMTEFFNGEFPRANLKRYSSKQISDLLCWLAALGHNATAANVRALKEIINN